MYVGHLSCIDVRVDLTPFAGDKTQFSRLVETFGVCVKATAGNSGDSLVCLCLMATLRGHATSNSETHSFTVDIVICQFGRHCLTLQETISLTYHKNWKQGKKSSLALPKGKVASSENVQLFWCLICTVGSGHSFLATISFLVLESKHNLVGHGSVFITLSALSVSQHVVVSIPPSVT